MRQYMNIDRQRSTNEMRNFASLQDGVACKASIMKYTKDGKTTTFPLFVTIDGDRYTTFKDEDNASSLGKGDRWAVLDGKRKVATLYHSMTKDGTSDDDPTHWVACVYYRDQVATTELDAQAKEAMAMRAELLKQLGTPAPEAESKTECTDDNIPF